MRDDLAARLHRAMIGEGGVTGVDGVAAAFGYVSKPLQLQQLRPLRLERGGFQKRVSEGVARGVTGTSAPDEAGIAERAAVMQFDGGLPAEIAEGLARLDTTRPPNGYTAARWLASVDIAARLADEWGAKALSLGWRAEDLFGLNPDAPPNRYDGKGLAFFLDPSDRVTALSETVATITTGGGATVTYRRALSDAGAVLAWQHAP